VGGSSPGIGVGCDDVVAKAVGKGVGEGCAVVVGSAGGAGVDEGRGVEVGGGGGGPSNEMSSMHVTDEPEEAAASRTIALRAPGGEDGSVRVNGA
jgi:hypothetical protein